MLRIAPRACDQKLLWNLVSCQQDFLKDFKETTSLMYDASDGFIKLAACFDIFKNTKITNEVIDGKF